MNRTEQMLNEFADDAKQVTKELIKEMAAANRNLSSLTMRLDKLLMILVFIGGGNLLLGDDLAGKVQRSSTENNNPKNQSVQVRSWNVPYYERLD